MIDRLGLGTPADLEAALVDLGTAVALPGTPDLAATVGRRLREGPAGTPPTSIRHRRTLRRSLLLAAALALLVAGAVGAIRVGLDLLSIDFGPVPTPSSTPRPSATASASPIPGTTLGLGSAVSLEEARASADHPLLVPADPGDPDRVFIGGPTLRGQVAFVYDAGPGLPAAAELDGAGLLITQNRGSSDDGLARKLIDNQMATVEAIGIDGAPGYWISGEPHFFWYLDPEGGVIEDSRRLIGDTLVWERDGVLYRIEGAITRDRALEIAASMR